MIIDNNLIFDSAQAITTTRDSTNIIDFSIARDMGDGENLEVIIQVDTAFTSTATTTTLSATFEVSTDNSTYTTAALSTTATMAQLTAGVEILNIHVPMRRLVLATASGGDAKPRYCKLVYTASATLSAGKITAWIGGGRQTNTGYPSGFTVAN